MIPLAIGSLALGAIQTGISAWQLHQLNKQPMPNYSITPELQGSYNRAQTRSGYGFSPEQKADYMSTIAGRYTQGWRNATDLSGGQLSGALSRGLQGGQLRDLSSFAAHDAQLQQNNIRYADQIGGQMTNQRNMIANQDINNRVRKEQAFGGALSSGLNNIAGAANFFAMNDGFKKLTGDTTTTPTVVTPQGQLSGYGMSDTGINLNPGVPNSAPAGGWGTQNQAGMAPQYDYTPDGLGINQAATQFNNTGLISPYNNRYSLFGGIGR